MNQDRITIDGIRTDLRKCVNPDTRIGANAEIVHGGKDNDSFIAASDGRIMAVLPVDSTASERGTGAIPIAVCAGKAGKAVRLEMNGEWRRIEPGRSGTFGPEAKTTVAPLADPEAVRFPNFHSVLPEPSPEKYLALKINVALLRALADAISSESDEVTLLIPPAMQKHNNETRKMEPTRIIGDVIPVVGDTGIGAIVPMIAYHDQGSCEAVCKQFLSIRDRYNKNRVLAIGADKDKQANKVK